MKLMLKFLNLIVNFFFFLFKVIIVIIDSIQFKKIYFRYLEKLMQSKVKKNKLM